MNIAQLLPKAPKLQPINVPTVDTVSEGIYRPFWSVMITSYKRTEYLAQAIRSVLEQGLEPNEMQIEVVDDCSPQENREAIEAIVREVGQGRVSFYSQPKNAGIYANWNTCIALARGHWLHILSDDDLVMPGFYEIYRRSIETYNCQVVLGQSVYINEKNQWIGISPSLQESDGILNNGLWVLSRGNPVQTAGIVVARQAYEKLGGFTTDLVFTPDWEMWTRLATSIKFAYVNRPYTLFRDHSSSETNRLVLTGASVTDSLAASKIIQSRFSEPEVRKEYEDFVNKWLSGVSCAFSRKLVHNGVLSVSLVTCNLGITVNPVVCLAEKYYSYIIYNFKIRF